MKKDSAKVGFMMNFQEIFRTAFLQLWTAASIVLPNNTKLLITSYIFNKMCPQMLKKTLCKGNLSSAREYSLIIYNCCHDFEETLAKVLQKTIL